MVQEVCDPCCTAGSSQCCTSVQTKETNGNEIWSLAL